MIDAADAQDLVDDFEAARLAQWTLEKDLIMASFWNKIEAKSNLGKDRTVFRYDDYDNRQKRFKDYIKQELLDEEFEVGDVNGVMTVKW